MLREAGWTAVSVPRGATLSDMWRQADRDRGGVVTAGGTTTGIRADGGTSPGTGASGWEAR
jgi:hypothetical protein